MKIQFNAKYSPITTNKFITLSCHYSSATAKGEMIGKTAVEVGGDGVAVISINNPPLNLLSVDVMLSLKENIEGTLVRKDVKAIVITGLEGKFSGGFDVTAFGGTQVKKTQRELGFMSIKIVTDTLEASRKPLVAAIEGMAFGGGLELALACHARISTSTAQLGLTELQYGILPGFGGTQRLPRLVGLPKALEMILMSKRVDGEEARSLSLVDAIAPADKLLGVARQWALDILEYRRPWVISLYKNDKLEPLAEARTILKSARLRVQKQNPNVMHPLVCIDVIEAGIVSGPRNALWKEAEALEELRESSTCRSLVHVFFAQRQLSKIPGISEMNLQPKKISKVAVIGGGVMSSEIAAMLLLRNYQVILKEKDKKRLFDEIHRIRGNLQNHVMEGKENQWKLEKTFGLLKGVLDYNEFKDVDLVIEAESEHLFLKQEIFANLEKYCRPHCIFTSNSSTFSLKLIGERTKCENRIARIHFFCPSPVMPFMEIIRTKSTSPQVIIDLINFGRKMRKTPIVVSDWKGYAVSSMFITYLHAAILLTERGVDVYQIDEALTSFGMPFGPFRMIDMIGLEVFAELCKIFYKNLPDRSYKPELILTLQSIDRDVKCFWLVTFISGANIGKGFYKYDNSGKATPDPEISNYLANTRNLLDVANDSKLKNFPDGEIVEMILFPAINKACHIISEGIVFRSSDLDVASVLGMGFPSYRGGIIYWSDSFASKYIYSKLETWSKEHGDFFKPCAYVTERASEGMSLVNPEKQGKSQL